MIFMFSYGANTNNNDMASRCPNSKSLCPAKILDYQLVFRIHADIELNCGSEVCGLLWEITEDDIATLDKLEGVPKYYIRHMIWVYPESISKIPPDELHNNNGVKAWVYEMVNKSVYDYPCERYWDICWDGYEANSINTNQLLIAYNMVSEINDLCT